MSINLHASPLQGFTDFRFRNTFNKYFEGIDYFYAPYIRINGKEELKKSEIRDIEPKNNSDLHLIPQVMTKNADEFLFVARYVQNLGYRELNWNLGCPYPMVAKRGLGSGLINDFSKIDEILNKVLAESDISISIKVRLGYESSEEILRVLPIFNKYPLKNIAIHPRIGKQLYKGPVDLDTFQICLAKSKHEIIYNGDIRSVADYHKLKSRFPTLDNWMIGRGLIYDPFLPGMMKKNTIDYPDERLEIFKKFHDSLFEEYSLALSGAGHILMRMYQFWTYFIHSFPNSPKGLKKIKKAKNIGAYQEAVREIFNKI